VSWRRDDNDEGRMSNQVLRMRYDQLKARNEEISKELEMERTAKLKWQELHDNVKKERDAKAEALNRWFERNKELSRQIGELKAKGSLDNPMPDDTFLGMKVSEWLEVKSLMSAYGISGPSGLRHALVRFDRIKRAVKTIMEETNG